MAKFNIRMAKFNLRIARINLRIARINLRIARINLRMAKSQGQNGQKPGSELPKARASGGGRGAFGAFFGLSALEPPLELAPGPLLELAPLSVIKSVTESVPVGAEVGAEVGAGVGGSFSGSLASALVSSINNSDSCRYFSAISISICISSRSWWGVYHFRTFVQLSNILTNWV